MIECYYCRSNAVYSWMPLRYYCCEEHNIYIKNFAKRKKETKNISYEFTRINNFPEFEFLLEPSDLQLLESRTKLNMLKFTHATDVACILAKKYNLLLEGHTTFISSLVVYDDFIISGGFDNTIRIWNLKDKRQEAVLEGHTSSINSLVISRDRKYIISCGDITVIIWNFAEKIQEAILKGHTKTVLCISVTNDNRHIVSGSADDTIRLWNVEYRIEERILKCDSPIKWIAITSDNKEIVYLSDTRAMKIWNISKNRDGRIGGKNCFATCQAITNDSSYIASASYDDYIISLWKLKEKKLKAVFKGHESVVTALVFTSDNKYIISASSDLTIRKWNIVEKREEIKIGHTSKITAIAIIKNDRICFASENGIWEIYQGNLISILPSHIDQIKCLGITKDRQYIVCSSRDKTFSLWNIADKKQEYILEVDDSEVWSLAITRNNRYIVSSSQYYIVKVWNLKLGMQK